MTPSSMQQEDIMPYEDELRKPKAHEILIPRRFDNELLMAEWASRLGFSYMMNPRGYIKYIKLNGSNITVEDTDYTVNDYPSLTGDE